MSDVDPGRVEVVRARLEEALQGAEDLYNQRLTDPSMADGRGTQNGRVRVSRGRGHGSFLSLTR
jgi:hypothetical protein